MAKESALYASIYKPTQLRKSMLMTVRDTVTLLKKSNKLNGFAEEKVRLLGELRDTVGELRALMHRVQTFLPTLADAPFEQHKDDREYTDNTKQTIVKSKIDFIEQELDKIESRIKGL